MNRFILIGFLLISSNAFAKTPQPAVSAQPENNDLLMDQYWQNYYKQKEDQIKNTQDPDTYSNLPYTDTDLGENTDVAERSKVAVIYRQLPSNDGVLVSSNIKQ